MSDIAIQVEQIGKHYYIGSRRQTYRTIRETCTDALAAPFRRASKLLRGHASGTSEFHEAIWALKDVSFSVKCGDVVGIIGRNGAGKSTLLKILSRITEPTEGRARIWGRVGSLLEVGTGFHPELTGRENVYLNGAILGMKRAEIARKFDEIVAFAETELFLDTPVKHYSSGMHVRLAFAVAAHLEPEVLVVDEVLAVGDVAFQKKCLGKMDDVAKAGRTVLFVSHNMAAISALCSKALLLSNGKLSNLGEVSEVIGKYMETMHQSSGMPLAQRTDRQGDGRVRFTGVTFLDDKGNGASTAVSGKPLTILLDYVTADAKEARSVDIDIAFYGTLGQLLFFCKAELGTGKFETIPPEGRIACHIPDFPLNPGCYRFKLWCQANHVVADKIEDAGTLLVEGGDFYGTGHLPRKNPEGIVMVKHTWAIVEDGLR
jgi:homopolymeric O-antigen transport system ATP-binding protein